jgi:hypothetical protein
MLTIDPCSADGEFKLFFFFLFCSIGCGRFGRGAISAFNTNLEREMREKLMIKFLRVNKTNWTENDESIMIYKKRKKKNESNDSYYYSAPRATFCSEGLFFFPKFLPFSPLFLYIFLEWLLDAVTGHQQLCESSPK